MMSILETALTLLGVILVLALAAQSIQEIIKSSFALKGHTTLQALEHLVTESARANSLSATDAEEIVKALRSRLRALGHRGVRSGAVRIDSITAEQLGDLLRSVSPDAVSGLRALDPNKSKRKLYDIAARAEAWFPLAMSPLDDRYRRRMRGLAIVSSAIVVLAVNADAFEIVRRARQDPAFREHVIALATRLDSVQRRADSAAAGAGDSRRAAAADTTRADSAGTAGDSVARRDSIAAPPAVVARAGTAGAAARLDSAQVLALAALSDDTFAAGPEGWQPKSYTWWVGILLSIALVSLGAPFWHDALEAVFGLKSRLRAEARSIERRTPEPAGTRDDDEPPPGVRAPNAGRLSSAVPPTRRRSAPEGVEAQSGGDGRPPSGDPD